MSKEINPCPFCGGEAKAGYGCFDENVWTVACRKCDALVPADWDNDTEQAAIKKWNERAG